jgi:hypothetical protein
MKGYYTESEVADKVCDMEAFREYVDGMDCCKLLDGIKYYKKEIVQIYLNR